MVHLFTTQAKSELSTAAPKIFIELAGIRSRLNKMSPRFSVALYGSSAYNPYKSPNDIDLLVCINRTSSLQKASRQLSDALCAAPDILSIDNDTIEMWASKKIDALRLGGTTKNNVNFGIHIFAKDAIIHNYADTKPHSINILMPNSPKYTEKKYLELDTSLGWRKSPCEYSKINEKKIIIKQYFNREDSANHSQILGILFDKFVTAIPLYDYDKASLKSVQKTIIMDLEPTVRSITESNLSLLFVKANQFDPKYSHKLKLELFYDHA
jgi:predicted nucleotidyltransferase